MDPLKLFSPLVVLFILMTANPLPSLYGKTDTLKGNTINNIDDQGMRQGYWRLTGGLLNEPDYRKDQVVEEGNYLDNKRNGIWKKYYPSGTLRSEITYENNHPRGKYTIFYENGTPEETGDWQGNRNVGEFNRFHRNGEVAQKFTFNEFGKRDGTQLYYYPNGKLQMTVEIDNGTAHGAYLSYYTNGELKSEKRIVNGLVEEGSVKEYKATSKASTKFPEPELPVEETKPAETDRTNLVQFKETGFNTLYNRNQQITQVGEFKEGRLWNGKWHRYDNDGILRKVEIYKDGRFTGYGVIDDSSK